MANVNPLHDISPGKNAPEIVNAIVEISKGSKVKYEIDKESGMIKLDRFLFSSMHYPGDYGFIPQTHWEDGDPLDIIVITGEPPYPRILATVKVIGVLHMIDNGESDDKIIGVYDKDPRYKKINSINDLQPHFLEEIKHFFETYKELEQKKVKVTEIKGKDEALKTIKKGIETYKKKFG